MILTRSDSSAIVLAIVQTAADFGGIAGAAVLSIWGRPKPRMHGVLGSAILVGSSRMLLGSGKTQPVWLLGSFLAAFSLPLRGSSNQTICLSKVDPVMQGRVFASRYLIAQLASPNVLIYANHFLPPTRLSLLLYRVQSQRARSHRFGVALRSLADYRNAATLGGSLLELA